MTIAARDAAVEELRGAFVELMGAERRLRGRDPHRPGELSHGQLRALFQLARDEESTAGCLARSADVSPASMTSMLDQLERDGFVTRRRSETDRRQVLVALTDAGRERLAAKRQRWDAVWQAALEHHPEAEVSAAAGVMRTIAQVLDGLGRD
jgi:MarR family transcriptional regulator, organic hydroperoxide resistance regulator